MLHEEKEVLLNCYPSGPVMTSGGSDEGRQIVGCHSAFRQGEQWKGKVEMSCFGVLNYLLFHFEGFLLSRHTSHFLCFVGFTCVLLIFPSLCI